MLWRVVIAHAGHWAAQLLYLVPVIVMVVTVLVGRLRGHGDEDGDTTREFEGG